MDRVGLAQLGCCNHTIDPEITIHRLGGTDTKRLVRQFEILRASIRFAENRYGFDTEFFASSNHTQSDFATVGDKYATEHRAP